MSHWFHRNPLKSTTSQSFNLSMISAQSEAIQICEQLKQLRSKLIELMSDPSTDATILEKQLMSYLSLLQGFTYSHQLDQRHGPNYSSKLRHYIRFKWTNTLLGLSFYQLINTFIFIYCLNCCVLFTNINKSDNIWILVST